MELLPWVFVMLRHSEINLDWLDSPEFAQQVDIILVNFCNLVKNIEKEKKTTELCQKGDF